MIKNRLIALSLLVAACDRGEEPSGYQGVIELDERVLAFEVPGRVTTLTALRGEQIDPSRVLATLDDSQPRASIAVREAEARAAEERAKLVAQPGRTEDIRALEAQLRAARSTEQLAVKRHADDLVLVSKGALAQALAARVAKRSPVRRRRRMRPKRSSSSRPIARRATNCARYMRVKCSMFTSRPARSSRPAHRS
jgi:multidrug resistance efflux pump